jgi:hypothetical protein
MTTGVDFRTEASEIVEENPMFDVPARTATPEVEPLSHSQPSSPRWNASFASSDIDLPSADENGDENLQPEVVTDFDRPMKKTKVSSAPGGKTLTYPKKF